MAARYLAHLEASVCQRLLGLAQRHAGYIRHGLQLCTLADGQDNQAALLALFTSLRRLLHNSARLKLLRVAIFFFKLYLELLFLQQLLRLNDRHIRYVRHINLCQITVKDEMRHKRNRYHAGGNQHHKFSIVQLFTFHKSL